MLVSNCSDRYVSTTFIYRQIFKKDVNIYDTSFVTTTTYDRKYYQAKKLKVRRYAIWMAQYWHLDCEWQYLQSQPLGTSPSHSWNETISSFHKDWSSSITDPFKLELGGGKPMIQALPLGTPPYPPQPCQSRSTWDIGLDLCFVLTNHYATLEAPFCLPCMHALRTIWDAMGIPMLLEQVQTWRRVSIWPFFVAAIL